MREDVRARLQNIMRNSRYEWPLLGMTARISLDAVYRYELTRRWDMDKPCVTWVMLNPSTADADADDATISKITRYTRQWRLGGLVVVNLFAMRATDPAELKRYADPVGPENDAAIFEAVHRTQHTIAAWGALGDTRGEAVEAMLRHRRVPLYGLAVTKRGVPAHPLYLKGDLRPQLLDKLRGTEEVT